MLILVGLPVARIGPVLRRVQYIGGRCVVRTSQPDLTMKTIRNALMPCCQASHPGMPVGAQPGMGERPG